jgi:hypothetical protein
MNLVYLTLQESEMGQELPAELLPLINARNAKNGFQFVEGETWGDLRTKYTNSPTNGGGVERTKGGVHYWYLPFESHEAMDNFTQITVLTKEELLNFGFDAPEDVDEL